MKPLYLVVHPQCITQHERFNQPDKNAELERVLKEEEYRIQKEPTNQMPPNLPKNRLIRVCGIYEEICVWFVWQNLLDSGYRAEIYSPASFNAPP
ncbi:hypothetical protein MYX06_03650 [Patescibacteria group bacterium AH-259-L05]|nr:hypothetical protein [Patescibacteria group bacterium AH-259-L05]